MSIDPLSEFVLIIGLILFAPIWIPLAITGYILYILSAKPLNWLRNIQYYPIRNTFRILGSLAGLAVGGYFGISQGIIWGAVLGTMFPVIGTAIGSCIGGCVGAMGAPLAMFICQLLAKHITRFITFLQNMDNPNAISHTNPQKYALKNPVGFNEPLEVVRQNLKECREIKIFQAELGYQDNKEMLNDCIRAMRSPETYADAKIQFEFFKRQLKDLNQSTQKEIIATCS